jgi:hypothetical protein
LLFQNELSNQNLLIIENFFSQLARKSQEISEQNQRLKKEADDYRKRIVGLEAEIGKKKISARQSDNQRPVTAIPEASQHPVEQMDPKPTAIQQQPTAVKKQSTVVKKLPTESQKSSQKPSQKVVQPNFLGKYEFKKLSHFEKMQQERAHQTEKSETELETECLDNHENVAEDNKDFGEVRVQILKSIHKWHNLFLTLI